LTNCMNCDFYKQVAKEEGSGAVRTGDVLQRLN
jgi:hypothetical protein